MSHSQPRTVDVLIIGAGGAGLFCASRAAARGRTVLVIDHAKKVGGKILISGGGRCNFTNTGATAQNYVSQNPHFAKSALSRYEPEDFIALIKKHGIAYHEKKLGQLFCDGSAQAIVDLLVSECREAGAEIQLDTQVNQVTRLSPEEAPMRFRVTTSRGAIDCESLVIATGGLSIPKIGATGFGYTLAQQFGLTLVERAAALDGFTFTPEQATLFHELSGVSVDCVIRCNDSEFRENILFTHSGLSGPAALQASLHWYPGDAVVIDLLPAHATFEWFLSHKRAGNRALIRNLLSDLLPTRLALRFCDLYWPKAAAEQPLPQVSERELQALCDRLHAWTLIPQGTVGYNKAEVTRGGVNTDELSSKTLESKKVPGLYFIGEVVDVTGWLGGYNFQWAWASAAAAASAITSPNSKT